MAEDVATPDAFVVAVFPAAKVALAPLLGAANVTTTFGIPFPPASFTTATKGAPKAVPTVLFCGVPLTTAMDAGAPTKFVREKLAGVPTLATDAFTVYEPTVELALTATDVATPDALVVAVTVPPAKVALAPLPGAAKVTTTPGTGLLFASFTVTDSGEPKTVLIAVLCVMPPVAVIDAGAPAVLVAEKFAEAATPVADAVTV
jgi:hypothetical protein